MANIKKCPVPGSLKRELGVFQAMMLGLGSILGTGVFISIGIATNVAGNAVLLAIACAALLALCNGISSAQLAANHPVSGGTYEYGYRWLGPRLGFTAGWMFMFAKSASAATAALGLAGYFALLIGAAPANALIYALVSVFLLSMIALTGIKRSSLVNTIIVSITLLSLVSLIVAGLYDANDLWNLDVSGLLSGLRVEPANFLESIALMFVAYTGYGRIATLGEEVKSPRTTIPVSIMTTLFVSMALYGLIAFVSIQSIGAKRFGTIATTENAPLRIIAETVGSPLLVWVISLGAITAMLGVLLNLILGLSRVLLAMGRRRDVPGIFGSVHPDSAVPRMATYGVTVVITLLVLIGNVQLTWSFSAFTVLIYYALTNLCAIRLTNEERFYPKWISVLGLFACLFLAFWIEWQVLCAGTVLLVVGQLWQTVGNYRSNGATAAP